VMAVPLLRALRAGRPDAEITIVAKTAFTPLLEKFQLADRIVPLPKRGPGYFFNFWKRRREHPDVYLVLTHSVRGDLEAWFTRCRQRFGVVKHGRRRPLLSHRYVVPPDFDERTHHQFELWENAFRHFGLLAPVDRAPLLDAQPSTLDPQLTTSSQLTLGFIAGSENNPEKRWPVAHWRALLETLLAEHPGATVLLFGTANDRILTDEIARGFDGDRVQNLAGRTTLAAYMEKLGACTLLVTNDTGGMHLANALGVPLIALFGPTNPVRTGPVFASPFQLLQPPGCPPTGGGSLTELSPAAVFTAIRATLPATGEKPATR
jgi:heptosyltransferase II